MKSKWFYAMVIAVAIAFCFSCSGKKDGLVVINFSSVPGSELSAAVPAGTAVVTNSRFELNDSLILRKSLLVISCSVLNRLNYQELNSMQRWAESGGLGIVAIRDTTLILPDALLPVSLHQIEAGNINVDGKKRAVTLEHNHSQAELKNAIATVLEAITVPDLSLVKTLPVPDSNQYAKITLAEGLDEPMQMTILPGNDVLIIERKGAIKLYDAEESTLRTIANVTVFSGIEDGLLGIAADPNFSVTHFIYMCYAVAGDKAINRLSRFRFTGDSLLFSSEKVMLEYPTQRRYCCHSAGAITFDSKGNLYLSTGDNTNAEETEGYTPVDERPGRHLSDDQATAANTMDLRGKILRIHPEPGGGYSIPEGNLFPPGGDKGRPEIFVMGCRNPFRISVDPKNGNLYWGDVGPDTKVMSSDGLMSFDEFNQAKTAGFFGWPYFLADNKVFPHYNYATKKLAPGKDPARPLNLSPNNTGARELPPARPAMIWYNKSTSSRFPLVGKGGASAMAGPVYYRDNFPGSRYRLGDYYDGKLIVFDWVRRWMMAISFDDKGNYQYMEPFLDHLRFASPIDLKFAADGALYVLEYGSNGFAKNADARLTRVEFQEGNRDPVPEISIDRQYGAVPLEVSLSAGRSRDFDPGDKLLYEWKIGNERFTGDSLRYTFTKAGLYKVELTVLDSRNGKATRSLEVVAGNASPQVRISATGNRSFYLGESLGYNVTVTDDGVIDSSALQVHFGYIPHGTDAAVILAAGDKPLPGKLAAGKALLASLDCGSCHLPDGNSAGPSYKMIAERYRDHSNALGKLATKIIRGGSGNWGSRSMAAHPDLSESNARSIVDYILAGTASSLPVSGKLDLTSHTDDREDGVYLLVADYKDKGQEGLPALSSRDYVLLRNPLLQAETFDEGNVALTTVTTLFLTYIRASGGKYIKFDNMDLTGIGNIDCRLQPSGVDAEIEMRIDSIDGKLVSRLQVTGFEDAGWVTSRSKILPVQGRHPVYFVFKNNSQSASHLLNLDWIKFAP